MLKIISYPQTYSVEEAYESWLKKGYKTGDMIEPMDIKVKSISYSTCAQNEYEIWYTMFIEYVVSARLKGGIDDDY